MDVSPLFQPLDVRGKLKLRNRIVMAPMTTISGEESGAFSKEEIAYLARRAEHGVGLVMTPACYVHKSGHSFKRQVGCHTDKMLDRMTACAEAINDQGAASFLQIHHGGNAAKEEFSGGPPLAPSPVHNRRRTSELPRAMLQKEIEMLIEAFAAAAGRAKKAGFTGVEIHGANTYLFQQFFSPFTNKRKDKWGGDSMEKRSRFAREVVQAVRSEVGNNYPLSYRISPEEEDPEGYSVSDAIELLKLLVDDGIDIVHVSSWDYGKGIREDYPSDSHPTLEIRRALPEDIPVIGVGSVITPEDALEVCRDGVELVAIGRALLTNPDWVEKVRDGRSDELRGVTGTEESLELLHIPTPMQGYIRRWYLPDDD